jgi:hypothetical protein
MIKEKLERRHADQAGVSRTPQSDALRQAAVRRYDAWFDAVKEISGWFYREDAKLFAGIQEIQADSGISGDLLEIGVYHGKSAAFLGFLRRPGERFIVCDLFGSPAGTPENQAEKDAWYPDLTREAFERTYQRFHRDLPDILACASNRMPRSGKLARNFRFVHIDGSHLYRMVRQDIHRSSELLKAGGVMAIDDYRSAHTPGVAAAAWEAVFERRLAPICVTPQKMYVTAGAHSRFPWLKRLMEWAEAQQDLKMAVESIRSRRMLRFGLP